MEKPEIVWCNNTSCNFWCDDECLYGGTGEITPNPESNADCWACEPCWFEWE